MSALSSSKEVCPNVLAFPLEEAVSIISSAGWTCSDVVYTAPPQQGNRKRVVAEANPGTTYVIRQKVLEGNQVTLTVTLHPGAPSPQALEPEEVQE